MRKRVTLFVTLIAVIMSSVAMAQTYTSSGYQYTVTNNEATITGYTGASTVFNIPATLGGYPVTAIGDSAFAENTNIKSVGIPEGVISLGKKAFQNCTSLHSIDLPDSIQSLGERLFLGCSSLKTIEIPSKVTSIPLLAFHDCKNLATITLHEGLLSLEYMAFYGCTAVKSIVLPESLTFIGSYAFQDCINLTEIRIPYNVTTIDGNAFWNCQKLGDVYITEGTTSIHPTIFNFVANKVVVTTKGSYAHEWCIKYNIPFRLEMPQNDYFKKLSVKPEDFEIMTYLCMAKMATLPFDTLHAAVREEDEAISIVADGNGFPKPIWNETTYGNRHAEELAFTVSYDDLFRLCLNNWRICRVEQNKNSGYGVTVFKNDQKKEIVIAYRASDPLDSEALINDWIENDFILYLTNKTGPQLPEAINTYKAVLKDCPSDYSITLTGHSLGGGLALAVSTLENARARTFNSVPMFSSVFENYPSQVNLSFDGIDKLDHRDFISERDVIAGLWDTQKFMRQLAEIVYPLQALGTIGEIKDGILPTFKELKTEVVLGLSKYFIGEFVGETWVELEDALLSADVRIPPKTFEKNHSMFKDHIVYSINLGDILLCHDLHSLFSITDNEFHFNQLLDSQEYTDTDYAYFSRSGTSITLPPWRESAPLHYVKPENSNIVLGATGDQTLSAMQAASNINDMIYGGDGKDTISSLDGNDVLLGGKDNDTLSGDTGNDQYVYTKGDDKDIIYDISGDTHIYLEGFDETDTITCDVKGKKEENRWFHVIKCNGEEIISVCIDRAIPVFDQHYLPALRPDGTPASSQNWLYIHKDGEVIKIADAEQHNCTRYVFQCPVEIQVYGQNQKLVATIESGENQSLFTEYGHFYSFEEKDGGYGKVIELFEGNSLRVSGEDSGELDLIVEDMGVENPYALGAQKIPVKKGSQIMLYGDLVTGMHVTVDHDNDGIDEFAILLTNDLIGASMKEMPTTGDNTNIGWYLLLLFVSLGLAMSFVKRPLRAR